MSEARHYRRLLAAVDLAETTEAVVARSADLGARCGAAVDLLNVLEEMPAFLHHTASRRELDEVMDRSMLWSRDRLIEVRSHHPGIQGIHVTTGVLSEEVSRLADTIDADLLVLGAHERGGLAVLFRDRSDEILHAADRDVLVVKTRVRRGEDGEVAPYRGVVAALDFSAGDRAIATRASQLAELHEAPLTLLHVIDHFPVDRSNRIIVPEDRDPLEFQREDSERRLDELAEAAVTGACRRKVAVSSAKASRAVPAFAAEQDLDLIVVGSHGRHGLGQLLGSTTDGIIHRAPCDVLVVRTAEPVA